MELTDTANVKPKDLSDTLYQLSLLSLEAPRNRSHTPMTSTQPSTAKKNNYKPLSVAEMNAELEALKGMTGRKQKPSVPTTASTKRRWNSSVKVEKKISRTANGQDKHNAVRKVLTFNSQPQAQSRATMANVETYNFPKLASILKKPPLRYQGIADVRISGVFNIPQTPLEKTKPVKNKVTIANKENVSNSNIPIIIKKAAVQRKTESTPKAVHFRMLKAPCLLPNTPLSNDTPGSSCDASFIQKEREIEDTEAYFEAINEDRTLENILEVSPPFPTHFKDYRNVEECLNNTSVENSANDDTIMSFDKSPPSRDDVDNVREESIIVSLCDRFDKAAVTKQTIEKSKTELEILEGIKQEAEKNIRSQLKLLIYVNKLIQKKRNGSTSPVTLADPTLTNEIHLKFKPETGDISMFHPISPILGQTYKIPKNNGCHGKKNISKSMLNGSKSSTRPHLQSPVLADKTLIQLSPETGDISTCQRISPLLGRSSVIRSPSKSPSYKISRKNGCLRKKCISKSMPEISSGFQTPKASANKGKARSMFMQLKEQMEFLKTPVLKDRPVSAVPDTPAITKHNLQVQLDKLFN